MQVWIVMYEDNTTFSSWIEGVYSTSEAAERRAEELRQEERESPYPRVVYGDDDEESDDWEICITVDGWEVDPIKEEA